MEAAEVKGRVRGAGEIGEVSVGVVIGVVEESERVRVSE